jgi:RNA polymerase sigma factor (sigma-70 family)
LYCVREREEAVTGASVTAFRRPRGQPIAWSLETEVAEPENSRGRIHIVDDDPSFATAMERRLRQAGYAVAIHASAQHLLDHLPTGNEPSCLVLDVQMPGLDGPALQKRLRELGSTLPIIFLSGHADTSTVVQTVKAGAQDFLTKPVSSDDLLAAIKKAFAHQRASRDRQIVLENFRACLATLTPRERQVFELIVRGKINKQIGAMLGATERTIKAHRHMVMKKLQVQSLAELVSLAERIGFLNDRNRDEPAS